MRDTSLQFQTRVKIRSMHGAWTSLRCNSFVLLVIRVVIENNRYSLIANMMTPLIMHARYVQTSSSSSSTCLTIVSIVELYFRTTLPKISPDRNHGHYGIYVCSKVQILEFLLGRRGREFFVRR